jgi:hypothetical protein
MDQESLNEEVTQEMTEPAKTPDVVDEDSIPDWLK